MLDGQQQIKKFPLYFPTPSWKQALKRDNHNITRSQQFLEQHEGGTENWSGYVMIGVGEGKQIEFSIRGTFSSYNRDWQLFPKLPSMTGVIDSRGSLLPVSHLWLSDSLWSSPRRELNNPPRVIVRSSGTAPSALNLCALACMNSITSSESPTRWSNPPIISPS